MLVTTLPLLLLKHWCGWPDGHDNLCCPPHAHTTALARTPPPCTHLPRQHHRRRLPTLLLLLLLLLRALPQRRGQLRPAAEARSRPVDQRLQARHRVGKHGG